MFEGKVIVITGASSGLGRALALRLATDGAKLALFSRDAAALVDLKNECNKFGPAPLIVVGDVTIAEDCARLIDTTIEAFSTIDYLVLNAGISMWAKFDEVTDLSLFQKLIQTNYIGAVNCVYYALPHLKKSKGLIVAISSLQGKLGIPFHTGYAASKHALEGFLDALRLELNNQISILVVSPTWIRGTHLRANSVGPDGHARGEGHETKRAGAILLHEACNETLRGMQKRKQRVTIPSYYGLVPWLKLFARPLLDFLVRRKMAKQCE